MQVTITFETVLDMVKQLSLTDQMRLVEWVIRQIKQNFVKETPPNIATSLPTFDSIPQRIPGLHARTESSESIRQARFGSGKGTIIMADDFDAPLDDFKEYMYSEISA